MSDAAEVRLLSGREWKLKYESEDGDLVELFYNPALERAVRYDRTTGYFRAEALALAARGLAGLCANDGQMRLVVGCTLEPRELAAIEQGYDLRQAVHQKLSAAELTPPDETAREALELLAWLIEHERLEVRVAVPVDAAGRPLRAEGIYHEKVGVIEDASGEKLTFSGSNNETAQGWGRNTEGFHVHCTWRGDSDHADYEVESFERLWNNRKDSVRVFDFPEAARQRLLEFLPAQDKKVTPPLTAPTTPEPPPSRLAPEELRRIVWTYIANAARMENGIRVGEATSTVQPWPHQLRTYARFVREWPCRLLVADEVGLGKTITAGLILRQAWLEKKARRILVLTPAAVIAQWQNELYEKFNLNVPIYDGAKLKWREAHGRQAPTERAVARDAWHREPFVLCSSQLARRADRALDLLTAEPWDLIVLDEAHHARRRGGVNAVRNEPNALLELMRRLRPRTQSLLLLTATPMQVAAWEVYDLLDLLGLPDGWNGSWKTFTDYFEYAAGNPGEAEFEDLARMFRAAEAAHGQTSEEDVRAALPALSALDRLSVLKALRDPSSIPRKRLDTRRRAAALEILRRFTPMRRLMARHTRDLLREYHRQGMLGSPIATREVIDVPVEMTPSERNLYEAVETYISETYNNAAQEKRTAVGFVMTIYRRRLASSFQALRKTLNDRREKVGVAAEEDVSLDELGNDTMDREEADDLYLRSLDAEERAGIDAILKAIALCDGGRESKARRLAGELRRALDDGYDSAIVFTQYTDTLDSLKNFLAEEFPDWAIATYSGRGGERRTRDGRWERLTKEQVKLEFREGRVKLLVCTDAAGEGLNLQSCGLLANYDLPWNPMKVEQRIGRIDRIGQKHETVRILNFAYRGTVEEDVYFSLGQRIDLFRKIVGKLQPILSGLPKVFEQASLAPASDREAEKMRLVAQLERDADEARRRSFDIDFGAEQAAAPLDLPAPALTLEQIEEAMGIPALQPPSLEWKPKDPGAYEARLPGMAASVRVATRAPIFDDHGDNHQLFSCGGEIFDRIVTETAVEPEAAGVEGFCRFGNSPEGVFRLATAEGGTANSLEDLIAALTAK